MEIVYKKPSNIADNIPNNFCPGCMHSSAWKIIGEVLDEMELTEKCVWVAGVGCVANAHRYIKLDQFGIPHGRACAGASAFKRCNPETFVFTYQGDGDLAAIGLGETISAANRGDNFTVIFVNNAIYGMTGGQMAPTSLPGQVTQTSPYGRDVATAGYPIRVKAILKGFQNQIDKKGFSLIEVVSSCPTNWGMTPDKALQWVEEKMIPYYPLGVYKDRSAKEAE